MSFRFSAPLPAIVFGLRPSRVRARTPANDNQGTGASDALIDAALRHFAEHGLAAAQHARHAAETAFFADDRQGYRRWLEICRTLDRTMARELDRQASRRN